MNEKEVPLTFEGSVVGSAVVRSDGSLIATVTDSEMAAHLRKGFTSRMSPGYSIMVDATEKVVTPKSIKNAAAKLSRCKELVMGAEMSRLITPISIVDAYIKTKLEKTDPVPQFDVYVVWFCYILGGWKALVSTTLPDGMYYEVTYNKEKRETYLDAYKKHDNLCIPDMAG